MAKLVFVCLRTEIDDYLGSCVILAEIQELILKVENNILPVWKMVKIFSYPDYLGGWGDRLLYQIVMHLLRGLFEQFH
jgi:hypothetical protein